VHAGRRIHTATLDAPKHPRTASETPPRRQPAEPRALSRERRQRPRQPSQGVPPAHPDAPARPHPSLPQAGPSGEPGGLGGPLAPRAADLRLSIAAPAVVHPRGAFTYRIRLANKGPATPDAVTVRSLLPAGVVRTGSSLPGGVGGYAGERDATLVLGRLAPGRSMTARFRVRVRPKVRGDLVAWSGIVYTGGVRDRSPGDNTATVTTRIER
jgi:uncharacterized repeat protein (TIGR01451 family)